MHAQDSIAYKNGVVTPHDTLAGPLPTFLQTLQGSMPNHCIVSYQLKNNNPYTLTPADKDSVYAAAFNGQIVQQAIKTKFNGKSKLYEKGHELEFISMLLNDSITNDVKKKLLTGRILTEWQFDEKNGRPTDYKKLEFITDGLNLNGNELYVATEGPKMQDKGNRKAALADFVMNHNDVNFSRMRYVIENRPYEVTDAKSLQMLFAKLRRVDVTSISLITGGKASGTYGSSGVNGVVVIKSVQN